MEIWAVASVWVQAGGSGLQPLQPGHPGEEQVWMLWAQQAQQSGSPGHVELPGHTVHARYCISRVSRCLKHSKISKVFKFQTKFSGEKRRSKQLRWMVVLCGLQSSKSILNQVSHSKKNPKCVWFFFSPTPLLVLSKWCLVAPLAYSYPSSCPHLRNTRPRKTQEAAEHKIILQCLQTPNYTALALPHGWATLFVATPKNVEAKNSHNSGFPTNILKMLRYVSHSACHWNKEHFACLVYFETLCNQTAQLFA